MSSTSLRTRHWWASWVNLLLNSWGSKGRIETHDVTNSVRKISIPRGIFSNPISVATLWNECEDTEKILQRCITSLLQWVRFDKLSNKFVQLVYLNVWMKSCGVSLDPSNNRRKWSETCHHYIWKSEARKAILLDREERSRRRVPKILA